MVKVTKNGQTKEIQEEELSIYLAMGWVEVKENSFDPNNFKIK